VRTNLKLNPLHLRRRSVLSLKIEKRIFAIEESKNDLIFGESLTTLNSGRSSTSSLNSLGDWNCESTGEVECSSDEECEPRNQIQGLITKIYKSLN